ncbi:TonB-dependent siderophore receptor [Azospirillum thiophilum]|uniref:TonB-dependent siderophore receptor n=1 Tax=Azospirillum thiophilum TaxID=528244 RepID=UPI000ABAA65E|nr:TonB-dependent siderophore receptor [Azospirillum thiophilum]
MTTRTRLRPFASARLLALAACTLPLSNAPALAQTAEDKGPKPILLAPILLEGRDGTTYTAPVGTTATRLEVPVMEVPQAVTTVTGQALRDREADSIDDALATVSGVTQTNTVAGKEDAVIRRGFGFSRDGSILTDGLKTVLPHSFNATVSSVDVLKGPASTLYGVLDPGGMINLTTKKPESRFGGTAYTRLDAYGAGRTGAKAGVDATGPVDGTGLSWRFIAEGENGDYWRNFGTRKSWTVAPSLRWTGETTDVTLSYLHQDYEVPYDRGTVYDTRTGRFAAIDRRTRLDEEFGRTDGASDLAKLLVDHRLGNGWKLSAGYAWSADDFRADQVRVLGFNGTTGIVNRRADVRDDYEVQAHAARLELMGDTRFAGMTQELLFGLSYDHEATDRTALQNCRTNSSFNMYNPVYGRMAPCAYVPVAGTDEHERIETASLYLQDRIHLARDWILVAGMRYQGYDIRAGRGAVVNTDTDGHVWLPNLGLVWTATPALSFYANTARSFRPNSSITSAYGSLPPETGTSHELGAKFELAQGITGTLALYTARKKNVAYAETVNGTTVYRTAGLVRSRGVELDLAGQLTERLQLIGSYGFTDAKVLDDPDYAGKQLANVARQTAAVYLAYDHGALFGSGGGLRLGGGVRLVGARAGDNANSYDLPGYGVVDAFAAYTFDTARPVTVQLNLNNLFDKTYYTSSIGNSAYGIAIGDPFNASLRVSVAF